MALLNVNGAQWDLLDDQGAHLQPRIQPTEPAEPIKFPTRWRIFGPLGPHWTEIRWDDRQFPSAEPKATANVGQLAKLDDQLTIGGETLEGRDVQAIDGLLDFDSIFGQHEQGEGHQVYAMAELEVSRETDLIIGAGADWWMQWWIDGQSVFDNLATGNGSFIADISNNCFHYRLSPGRHVLSVLVISGSSTTWRLKAGLATARDEAYGQCQADLWNFLDDPDEILPPSDNPTHLHKAFRTDLTLSDETIECEYQILRDNGHVGIAFAAQDADHYYWAYIPHWGQLWRARAVYAAIGIADGSGYIRHLDLKLMPNVPCQYNVWKTLRVERRGNHIQMWINGVKGPTAVDDSYGPGRVGVCSYNHCTVQNLKIDGKREIAGTWPKAGPRQHNFTEPFASENEYNYHGLHHLIKLSSGQVLMTSSKSMSGSPFMSQPGQTHYQIHLSDNAGRTWSNHGEAIRDTDVGMLGCWVEISPGVLRAIAYHNAPSANEQSKRIFSQGSGFYYRDSSDLGHTWSDWSHSRFDDPAGEISGANRSGSLASNVIVLHDGSFVVPMLRNTQRAELESQGQGTWPTMWVLQPFASRSTDQGLTWSPPVAMDNATFNHSYPPDSPVADYTETPMAQLPSGRIVAVSRSCAAPFMWQTHSDDGGLTWRQSCYASFSGAGNPQLIATQSEYLVVIARCTGVGMHVSIDGGTNWSHGAMLDSPNYYNGLAIEVEPDVILNVYPVIDSVPGHLRVQRLRVTPEGPLPTA